MTLNEFHSEKGFKNIQEGADFFSVSMSSYQKYLYFYRYPSARTAQLMVNKSEGLICLNKWNSRYLEKAQERVRENAK